MRKPPDLFDRDREWDALLRFVQEADPQPLLGVVLGRRRMGKTFLLRRLVQACGGLYHVFPAGATTAELLEGLGVATASFRNLSARVHYDSWKRAFTDILELGRDRAGPTLVVLDEISYALAQDATLGSVIQHAFDAAGDRRHDPTAPANATRLVLCGSAMSVMEQLLASAGPLHGRSSLRLLVHPFDPTTNTGFWELGDDAWRALLVQCVVGGTPAYRSMLKVAPPEPQESAVDWLLRELLAPHRAIFTEARSFLSFDDLRNPTIYAATLRAIGAGACRVSEIAGRTGATPQTVTHRLGTLSELRLVRHLPDAFRQKRGTWALAEPLLRVWFAVMEPSLADIDAQLPVDPGPVDRRFRTQILGPGFEQLCRWWVRTPPAQARWRIRLESVARAELRSGEVDVVGLGHDTAGHPALALLGEAKARSEPAGPPVLRKLDQALADVPDRYRKQDCFRVVFSTSGFQPALVKEADARPEVELIDLRAIFAPVDG